MRIFNISNGHFEPLQKCFNDLVFPTEIHFNIKGSLFSPLRLFSCQLRVIIWRKNSFRIEKVRKFKLNFIASKFNNRRVLQWRFNGKKWIFSLKFQHQIEWLVKLFNRLVIMRFNHAEIHSWLNIRVYRNW